MRPDRLVVAVGCVAGVAVALAAASLLDAPWLGWVAVGLLLAALAFREASIWEGDGRGWLVMWGTVAAVVLVAYLASLAFV